MTVSKIFQLSLEKVKQVGSKQRIIVELDFTTSAPIPYWDNPVEYFTERVIEQELDFTTGASIPEDDSSDGDTLGCNADNNYCEGIDPKRTKRSNMEAELYLQEWEEVTYKIKKEGVITLALVQLPGVILGFLGIIKAFSMYGRSKEAWLKALR